MMKNLTSRQKILFGVYAMILAMLGDYLLGFGTFSFSDSPDAYLGMTANVVPDWRYAGRLERNIFYEPELSAENLFSFRRSFSPHYFQAS